VFIWISSPNLPLLDNLEFQFPILDAIKCHQFDFKETVQIVSYTNIFAYPYNRHNSQNVVEITTKSSD